MFCWKSKWKVSTVSLLLRSGNSLFLHDVHSRTLSDYASASYSSSVRWTHCAWNHSMQSLSHWMALVPSSTSFPHMPHGYWTVFKVLKAIKRVRSTHKRAIKPIRLTVLLFRSNQRSYLNKWRRLYRISFNSVYTEYTESVLLPFLTGGLQLFFAAAVWLVSPKRRNTLR